MQQLKQNSRMEIDESLLRHMAINSIRSYVSQFRSTYGEIVIAYDSRNNWRRNVFPYYKVNRKKDRDSSALDWHTIFASFDKIRAELKENFPYRIVDVDCAEADDIIAVLSKRFHSEQKILILSTDKDFLQLQKYDNVSQYSPITKTFIKTNSPERYLKEHIIRGDAGDGVPNILSADNIFLIDERQKSVMAKKLEVWLDQPWEEFCTTDTMKRGWSRNVSLIDLTSIPKEIEDNINRAYDEAVPQPRKKLMNYFIENRLRNLIEHLGEF